MAISLIATCKTHYSSPAGEGCKYAGHSVKALPIRILTLGKKRSSGVQLIVDDYIDKLKHYCRVEDVRVKSNPKNARDIIAQIEHEDMAVMDLIRSNEWVVMLDEHGLDVGSEQMASLIGDAGNKGASSLLFCIGGPYGHGRQLRERANVSIKLSSLVLNHEIALVVLCEQLYRNLLFFAGKSVHSMDCSGEQASETGNCTIEIEENIKNIGITIENLISFVVNVRNFLLLKGMDDSKRTEVPSLDIFFTKNGSQAIHRCKVGMNIVLLQ